MEAAENDDIMIIYIYMGGYNDLLFFNFVLIVIFYSIRKTIVLKI